MTGQGQGLTTPLFEHHVALNGHMVDFSGWQMPLHYGSQIREHHEVRQHCGVFDVSHMGVVDLSGDRMRDFLHYLLTNDVDRLTEDGQAQYTLMLAPDGGILDDLMLYRLSPTRYRMVVNAGRRVEDLAWITEQALPFGVRVMAREVAMLALQGPQSAAVWGAALGEWLPVDRLPRFSLTAVEDGELFVARTGYTGEDGFEIVLPVESVGAFWNALLQVGVPPVGLGARDTLRLEAGLNLYGSDMDVQTTPLESGLGWTVAPQGDFIGRQGLVQRPVEKRRIGVRLQTRGVLRNHQTLFVDGVAVGEITSGGYSPTLETGIGLARVQREVPVGAMGEVEIRGKRLPVLFVAPPFVPARRVLRPAGGA